MFSASLEKTSTTVSGEYKHRGGIITIASGKGGVGKTCLAVNLAIELTRQGRRTVLVDADFGRVTADIVVSGALQTDAGRIDCVRRGDREIICEGGALRICAFPGADQRAMAPPDLAALQALKREFDSVLIDCAAGHTPLTAQLTQAADQVIVVTTPEPPALAAAYSELKLIFQTHRHGRYGVILNMASRRQAIAAARRLRQTARRFLGVRLASLGHVPFDRCFGRAVAEHLPACLRYPRCAGVRAISDVSRRICGAGLTATRPPRLWERVARVFL